jgi:hypothetical protein
MAMARTSRSHTLRRAATALAIAAFAVASASAQIEWDKKKTGVPLSNPVPIAAPREEIVAGIKEILSRSEIPIRVDGLEGERGVYVVATQPVVFARGVVANTQLGHYADLKGSPRSEFTRGRVALRVEIAPSSPTTSLVSVTGSFEGLRQATNEWSKFASRGLLEDRFLKLIVTNVAGQSFDDVQPDDSLLEIAG